MTPYIQPAEYPGGKKALSKAISEELQFPEVAKKYHATAKVKLSFIVDEEGNLSDITVKEYQGQPLSGAAFSKLSPAEQKDVEIQVKTVLSVEAIRTITAIGSRTKWNPGSERGKVMSTKFSQTINFKRWFHSLIVLSCLLALLKHKKLKKYLEISNNRPIFASQ